MLATQSIVGTPEPFASLTVEQLCHLLDHAPELVGTASVGKPNRGWLLNGVQLSPAPFWEVLAPERAFGTPELVGCLERAASEVQQSFPGDPIRVGDLSYAKGGFIRSHRSHQSGRDADVGYYYLDDSPWYTKADHKNLDRRRTWAFVRTLVTDCDIEYVFIDIRVQELLREHAEAIGERTEWLDSLFARGPGKPGIIRHTWGHQTHIHVRVHDPEAEAVGERVLHAELWARMRRPSPWARR